MYRELVKAVDPAAPESVHMLPWPTVREEAIDAELERGMGIARAFVEAGASARQQANLRLKLPISKAVIQTSSFEIKGLLERVSNVLKSQLNCKELVLRGPEEKLPEGLVEVATDFGWIGIDVRITPELRAEGLARELVRRLQMMRKDQDLAMEERIDVAIGTDVEDYVRLLATQRDYIIREVRVRDLRICRIADVGPGYVKDWNIDEDRFRLVLKRLPTDR
jgi:isoleucyl-tRNA synthetase